MRKACVQPISDLALKARQKKIDDAVMRVFRRHEFCAVYCAGSVEPVAKRIGDNRGAWPVKIGLTRALEDTISSGLDGASPFWEQRVLFRVWVKTWARGRTLEREVLKALQGSSEQARKSFWDMGPDFQREFFEMEVHTIAQCNGIETWDDDSLMVEMAREVKREFERRGKV